MQALAAGATAFHQRTNVDIGAYLEFAQELARMTAALEERLPRPAPWGGYLSVDSALATVVGTCGFKTGPLTNGEIEIAYATFEAFEGQGYATAAAAALVDLAWTSPLVTRVIAHTLPEPNASGRVLTRNGFRRNGEIVDPEDGLVWRWERDRQ